MKWISLMPVAVLALLLIACGGGGSSNPSPVSAVTPEEPDTPIDLPLTGCGVPIVGTTMPGSTNPNARVTFFTTDSSCVQADSPPAADGCEPDASSDIPPSLLVTLPNDTPTRLVVFAHGYKQNIANQWQHHMEREVRPGVAIVTTDYRDNLGFPTLRGAQDLIQVTLNALATYPSIETVYLLGVSMGGNISGTAINESVHSSEDGSSIFDYWIAVEAVTNFTETYSEAQGAGLTDVTDDMERDAGGTREECPASFNRRSPVTRAQEMADNGILAANVVHGVYDGTVPYNQGSSMAQALRGVQIPTQFFTVTCVAEGEDGGSVLPGTVTPGAAGHGNEGDETHAVIRTGFEQLNLMLEDNYDFSSNQNQTVNDRPSQPACSVTPGGA